MTDQLVQQWQEKAIPVTQACRVLGVSRAGYYQRQHRTAPARDVQAGECSGEGGIYGQWQELR